MLSVYKCSNPDCLHQWMPRVEKPKVCPKCQSPYWNCPEYFKIRDRKKKILLKR